MSGSSVIRVHTFPKLFVSHLISKTMSLSDSDTTIVAALADAGQRISSLSSNIALLQAILSDVSNTVMDPGALWIARMVICELWGCCYGRPEMYLQSAMLEYHSYVE